MSLNINPVVKPIRPPLKAPIAAATYNCLKVVNFLSDLEILIWTYLLVQLINLFWIMMQGFNSSHLFKLLIGNEYLRTRLRSV